MGGLGSGWFRDKKVSVEQCLCLDINDLMRQGLLKGNYAREYITWTDQNAGDEIYRVQIEIMPYGKHKKHLSITHYDLVNRTTAIYDQHIYLHSTKLVSGGKRWWFSCNGVDGRIQSKNCNGRVGKLYLPPGKRDFACRECYDLTYESCQNSTVKILTL